MNANQLFHQQKLCVLSFGCPRLDKTFGGGLRCGITEVTGESATGKTQLVLQLLVRVQLPSNFGGLDGSAVYLNTEGPFPHRRLQQLAAPFLRSGDECTFTDRVFLENISTLEEQNRAIFDTLPKLLKSQSSVRLVVLDSVTSLFRAEFSNSAKDLHERTRKLFQIASHLRRLSLTYNVPIVIVNQVSDEISDELSLPSSFSRSFSSNQRRLSSGVWKVPALGLAWASCLNARIFLTRSLSDNPHEVTRRWMHVTISPCVPVARCEFCVTQETIMGIAE